MNLFLISISLALPVLITGLLFLSVKIKASYLRLLLAFSAAYLFSLCTMHLLPECYDNTNIRQAGLYILIGFFIQIIIEFFSSGIEHGHLHLHGADCKKSIPFGMIFGLYLHSLLEGLPIYQSNLIPVEGHALLNVQQSMIVGIALHNIPIAIAFVTLLLDHGTSKARIITLLFFFAMMAPLGCYISYLLTSLDVSNYEGFLKASFGVVIGIFLHISTAIMFETSENHKYNLTKIGSMICGIIVALIVS
jgi:zinc and cadmium transporter